MIILLLRKLRKASESSWHEIWNLSDRIIIGTNQKIPFHKEESHRDRKSEHVWGRTSGPIHMKDEVGASAQGADPFSEFFMPQALRSGSQKEKSWRTPEVDDSQQMSVIGTRTTNV